MTVWEKKRKDCFQCESTDIAHMNFMSDEGISFFYKCYHCGWVENEGKDV